MGHGVCVNLPTDIMGRRILVYIQLVCVLAQRVTVSFWQAVKLFQKKKRKKNPKQTELQNNQNTF